jgi:Icc-related predicted phosphoesterase
MAKRLRLVILSDTHGSHERVKLPEGDVLIHAGDFLTQGTEAREIFKFNKWLGKQPFQHRIIVPGNHDILYQTGPGFARSMTTNAHLLINQALEIEGHTFYGSPATPTFGNWAFMLAPGPAMQRNWSLAEMVRPDVLITHGPPRGILDRVLEAPTRWHLDQVPSPPYGCVDLLAALPRIAPKLHCFGHIHTSHGTQTLGGIQFVNAAIVDEDYKPRYEPVVIDLEGE